MNRNTASIIEKWYKELHFPTAYDQEFYKALREIEIPLDTCIETYDIHEKDGKRNLLSCLYMCEELSKKYQKMEIPNQVFLDTLSDLVTWTNIWSEKKGELYLGQLTWISWHLKMHLFKLGRLQFAMQKTDYNVPSLGLHPQDDIIGIHIPSGDPLSLDACRQSVAMAKEFFQQFYPSYQYSCFTCHTWLLDSTLKEILEEGSNILKFRELFDEVLFEEPSDALLGYVFQWMSSREDVKSMTATTKLAKKVQDRINQNGVFHEALGVIKK